LRGGFIETSGHVFNFTGGSVNAGRGGAWLLDPVDLTIDATLAGTIATALNGGSNVTQQTSATGSGGNGDITVASGISWASDATLTLSAYRNIAVNANIASSGGRRCRAARRQCRHRHRHRDVRRRPGLDRGRGLDLLQPDRQQLDLQRHQIHGADADEFQRQRYGGATLKTYMLVNTVHDLQNIKNNLSGVYALGRDIDASATAVLERWRGFRTSRRRHRSSRGLSTARAKPSRTLTINRPSGQWVGLFGYNGASADREQSRASERVHHRQHRHRRRRRRKPRDHHGRLHVRIGHQQRRRGAASSATITGRCRMSIRRRRLLRRRSMPAVSQA
jgi:hypothetical protein